MGTVPMPPPRRVAVTREMVEYRTLSGQAFTFAGLTRPQNPQRGTSYLDANRDMWVFTGEAGSEWQQIAPEATAGRGIWRCAYCGTHFGEQRCPTCGAGRTEGQ
jgi:hypothetical protein